MTGSLLVNNLAGLLIITSMLVVIVRKPVTATLLYALQSLVLVLTFVALGHHFGSHELYSWAISAFITKVVLVPLILGFAFRKLSDPAADRGVIGSASLVLIAVIIVLVSYFAVKPVQLPLIGDLQPVLAVSMGHFFIGLLCIVSQRNILKQVFGYCLMENGSHLTLALLAHNAPELVEIGIATDSIFAVIIMSVLARSIYRQLGTLDVRQLLSLKG
ncbi:hydrogenase 4 membrane subunit [Celerinatantimonas sp. YJH-8]|uniref:hydrogenase 4 membrane subunit n=1 Tax=Celerinatantimonas sp. YJH-8 TaxID=3228714 RepID=UPI0038C6B6E0